MRFVYPAVITKKADGTYHGKMADLAMCYGDGDTLDGCIRELNQAAYDWIDLEIHEEDPELPPASDIDDLKKEYGEKAIVRNILIIYKMMEGWEE